MPQRTENSTRARPNARARAAALREQQRRKERRRRAFIIGGASVGVLGIVGAVVGVSLSGGSSPAQAIALPHPPAATSGTALPPWPAPADPQSGAQLAGLRLLNAEGEALHFHSHLDVFVNGKSVPVAAEVGIGEASGVISEMHTHDTSGVLHIEAPDKTRRYVLGQFFDEWNVRLDATHLGGLADGGGKTLTAYVDGKKWSGDPADIELTPHREIALVYGTANSVKVPSAYQFPAGL